MKRHTLLQVLLSAYCFFELHLPQTGQAADITVDASGACILADAITAANTDAATGGCPAGIGDDTITLKTDVILADALPEITSTVIIEGNEHTVSGNNDLAVGHVLTIENGNLTLNNTTITGGAACGGSGCFNGGGIFNNSVGKNNFSSVTLNNCKVERNNAGSGGGLYNRSSEAGSAYLTLNNSVVSENSSLSAGGIGSYSKGGFGSVTLNNSMVIGNTSDGFEGGGIANSNSSELMLVDSIVSGNTASTGGGIINNGTATLINSTVSGNSGGGISNYSEGNRSSLFAVHNSTVSGNDGGGVSSINFGDYSSSVITLNNSTISENKTPRRGGGIFVENGGIWIIDDRYYYSSAEIILNNCLVSGNTADLGGNEVYLQTNYGRVIADSFTLFGHSGESNDEAFFNFKPGESDLIATSDGTAPTALDSIIDSALADNGGPTKTHALVAGSPAIDLDRGCSTGLSTDQRGQSRPTGLGCDAGAFESSTGKAMLPCIPCLWFLLLKK